MVRCKRNPPRQGKPKIKKQKMEIRGFVVTLCNILKEESIMRIDDEFIKMK